MKFPEEGNFNSQDFSVAEAFKSELNKVKNTKQFQNLNSQEKATSN